MVNESSGLLLFSILIFIHLLSLIFQKERENSKDPQSVLFVFIINYLCVSSDQLLPTKECCVSEVAAVAPGTAP